MATEVQSAAARDCLESGSNDEAQVAIAEMRNSMLCRVAP